MEFLRAVLVGVTLSAVKALLRWAVARDGRHLKRRPEPRIRFLNEAEDEDDRD